MLDSVVSAQQNEVYLNCVKATLKFFLFNSFLIHFVRFNFFSSRKWTRFKRAIYEIKYFFNFFLLDKWFHIKKWSVFEMRSSKFKTFLVQFVLIHLIRLNVLCYTKWTGFKGGIYDFKIFFINFVSYNTC